MNSLPKDLENIVDDYKLQLDVYDNYKKVIKEFKTTYQFENNKLGNTRIIRVIKWHSYDYRFSTFCIQCGNFGDITEAIYLNDECIRTLEECDFNKNMILKYFHRITSRYYDRLPDRKFCYCLSGINELTRNLLLI